MIRLYWPTSGIVTQLFGENPQNYEQFGLLGHNGVDVAAPLGRLVFNASREDDGAWIRESQYHRDLGLYIKIEHEWGHSVYAHLSKTFVIEGQKKILPGQPIGRIGSTGNSTGPHLHFAVRVIPYDRKDGWLGYTDPLPYIIKGSRV